MAEVKLSAISKNFGKTKALENFSLEIEQGQLVSLLGPSGCGKTTALRILAGLTKSDSGKVSFDDVDVTRIPAADRDIGMVFQAYSLFPNMTAQENVQFGLKIRGHSKTEINVRSNHIFEVIGLENEMARYPHQLSGGQQQRVALARAIVMRPRILLLDEPLSALDAQVRTQLRDEIRKVQREFNITTLFVTHDQEEAMTISDLVGVMHKGKLLQLDTPQRIYQHPINPKVAKFVGSTNQIPVTVSGFTAKLLGSNYRISPNSDYSQSGAQLVALIRPEEIKVVTSNRNGVNGRISNISFLGPISHVDVTLDSGTEVRAVISSQEVLTHTVGNQVQVFAEADDVLVTNL